MNEKETKTGKIVDVVRYDEDGKDRFYSDSETASVGILVKNGDGKVQEKRYLEGGNNLNRILETDGIDNLEDLIGEKVEGVYKMKEGRFSFPRLEEITL